MAKFKFNKGDKVKVTQRNGRTLTGVVRGADINLCTYKPQYDVDFTAHDGKDMTLVGVLEDSMELAVSDEVAAVSMEVNIARAKGHPYKHIIDQHPAYKEYLESLGTSAYRP